MINHEDGRISCIHCGETIKIVFGEKVVLNHFIWEFFILHNIYNNIYNIRLKDSVNIS